MFMPLDNHILEKDSSKIGPRQLTIGEKSFRTKILQKKTEGY